jgi:hypothetical protein
MGGTMFGMGVLGGLGAGMIGGINQTMSKPDVPKGAKFCPECGSPIKDGAKFCGECGNKL